MGWVVLGGGDCAKLCYPWSFVLYVKSYILKSPSVFSFASVADSSDSDVVASDVVAFAVVAVADSCDYVVSNAFGCFSAAVERGIKSCDDNSSDGSFGENGYCG